MITLVEIKHVKRTNKSTDIQAKINVNGKVRRVRTTSKDMTLNDAAWVSGMGINDEGNYIELTVHYSGNVRLEVGQSFEERFNTHSNI